ncbi:NeuD/PglB/VioB family sugar acetyltransferase [Hydrogenimonas sp. SS33]|uniref:NeuD/PglB/VioB family sugar acetyltransferase n=1 Tax=Hydrogenimonas leucolamina TaxID=2954236 RepID=UPI00336BCFC1
MKPEIILIGGGGHCHSVIDVIERSGDYLIAGIIDKKELRGERVLGYDIIGSDDDLPHLFNRYKYAFVTIGQLDDPQPRVRLFNILKEIGYRLPVIVSPLAYVSKHALLQEGTCIMHHALVNANATVGKNCIINTKALIEHDAKVDDHCHISTGAVVNGGVHVKTGTFFGSNATSKQYIEVSGFIKAGSIVT